MTSLALLLLWTSAGDAPVFSVRKDAVIEKTFALEHTLAVQKMEFQGDDSGQLMQSQLEITSKFELEVADTYRKLDAGRPLELRRLFRNGSLHVDLSTADSVGKKTPDAWDAVSPLKGKSVVYTYVPEEKAYGRYYDEGESLEEYLASLSEDLDFRCLLPEGEVAQGADWTIDPSRLVDVFVPGGDVPLGFVKGGSGAFVRALSAGVGGPLHPVFGGVVKGNAKAHWVETKEVEGARLARIELAVSIETDRDRTEDAQATLPREDSTEGGFTVVRAGIKWKFQGSGTLVWNLGAGRFETLDLVGREDVTSDLELSYGTETSRQMIAMAGALKIGARAGPPKK